MENTFIREQVVINGCAGTCCEGFTMDYSIDDLKANKKAVEEGKDNFIDERGLARAVAKDPTVDTIIDMLIPLGLVAIEPNGNESYNDKVAANKYKEEDIGNLINIDGVYHKRLYTCKHFNKEQRICGNYDNRPHMCKNFGAGCAYTGCGFDKIYQELNNRITNGAANEQPAV